MIGEGPRSRSSPDINPKVGSPVAAVNHCQDRRRPGPPYSSPKKWLGSSADYRFMQPGSPSRLLHGREFERAVVISGDIGKMRLTSSGPTIAPELMY